MQMQELMEGLVRSSLGGRSSLCKDGYIAAQLSVAPAGIFVGFCVWAGDVSPFPVP